MAFYPSDEFIFWNQYSCANFDRGETLGPHQLVGSRTRDAQHLRHVRHRQHQGQLVIACIFAFSHSVPFCLPGGKDFSSLFCGAGFEGGANRDATPVGRSRNPLKTRRLLGIGASHRPRMPTKEQPIDPYCYPLKMPALRAFVGGQASFTASALSPAFPFVLGNPPKCGPNPPHGVHACLSRKDRTQALRSPLYCRSRSRPLVAVGGQECSMCYWTVCCGLSLPSGRYPPYG